MQRGIKLLALVATAVVGSCAPADESTDVATRAFESVERVRHTVESTGHPMAVWEKSASRPRAAILLVHGRTWSTVPDFDLDVPGEDLSLMNGLVGLGYATYGVDLRGYGETPRDETGWNTPNRAASDVASVLRWVRARHPELSVHLFGWSLGSMVSQLAAQQNPTLVDRLVLFGYPTVVGVERPYAEPDGDPPRAPTTAEAAASDFVVPGSISSRAVEAYVQSALRADPVRSDWTGGHEWNQLDPAQVRVPTLILQGEHDPLSTEESALPLFTGLGSADKAWVVIPGGDHAAFLEAPRPYFLSALDGFLGNGAG
jgi:alpha-beta hydrolase superfamily lysophospholipase